MSPWVLDERWSHNSSPFFLFWVGRNQKVGYFIQIDWSHQVRLRRSELDGRQLDIVASQARRLVSQYLILPPKHASIWMMMTRDYQLLTPTTAYFPEAWCSFPWLSDGKAYFFCKQWMQWLEFRCYCNFTFVSLELHCAYWYTLWMILFGSLQYSIFIYILQIKKYIQYTYSIYNWY